MDTKQFRKEGKELIDHIADYFDNIADISVNPDVKPGFLINSLPSSMPQRGEDFSQIMADYQKHVFPGIKHFNSPHFHAVVPAPVSMSSLLGDLLAAATAGGGFTWNVNPSYTELELVVVEWLRKIFGLPEHFSHINTDNGCKSKGGGVLQSSASESLLITMIAAKERALQRLKKQYQHESDGVLLDRLVAYGSTETHSSLEKAAKICSVKIRLIDVNDQGVIETDLLTKSIEADAKTGLCPFYYCSTLGSTVTCCYEPLDVIGNICQRWIMWHHVDAALGGSFLVCPEYRSYIKGVESADSFNVNCHKFLLTHFPCSALWVKDRASIIDSLNVDRTYFADEDNGIVTDFRNWQIAVGKPFRALKVWVVMRTYGLEGLQRHVREYMKRVELFQRLVEQDKRFEFWPTKPNLGMVCFRIKGCNELTQKLADNISKEGKIDVAAMKFKDKLMIRFHGGGGKEAVSCEENLQYIREAWDIVKNHTNVLVPNLHKLTDFATTTYL